MQKVFCSGFKDNMLTIHSGTISRCHKYLDGMGNINQQSVTSLSQEVKNFLKDVTPKRLKELAKMNCYAADKIKAELDKKYGEKNYTVIAIGRSLSSIAELMAKMGVNTKIIPLSGLRVHEIDNIPNDYLNTYKTFLAQKGLSKPELGNNKDKMYIITDYTYQGRSLKKAEKLLKKDELLGEHENLISEPVSVFLGEDYKNKGFKNLFQFCRFKDFSSVGKLSPDNLNEVFDRCSPEKIKEFKGNITQCLRKLFWFNVFDSYASKNYTNTIPEKELNAIYEHHLSQKAVRNYIKREMEKENRIINSI